MIEHPYATWSAARRRVTIWRHARHRDGEVVRRIRAAVFGRDQDITAEEHADWWDRMMGLPTWDFVCLIPGDPVWDSPRDPQGYGMLLRCGDGRLWVVVAVSPEARGHGLGTDIYRALVQATSEPIYAAIHADNAASRRASERAGYALEPSVSPPTDDVMADADWPVMRAQRRPLPPI